MPEPAFIDTNVPMYAAGREHAFKASCVAILDALADAPTAATSNAEALQEILHVYSRRGERLKALEVISQFDEALNGRIEPVTREDVLLAAVERPGTDRLDSRDRVHLAVMARLRITDIISTDTGFDTVPGIRRLDPLTFASWRDEVFGTGR